MEKTSSPPRRRRRRTSLNVVIHIPKHSSSVAQLRNERLNSDSCFILNCRQPGILWHGLYPMLFETSNTRVSQRLLMLLFAKSWMNSASFRDAMKAILEQQFEEGGSEINEKDENELDAIPFYRRTLTIKLPLSSAHPGNHLPILLYILPPFYETFLDRTFTAVVLEHERSLLKKQTMTAWMATLGGGYFFIKQLSKSLQLARQQRYLALQIGNESMARTCLLNEAYNLIYAAQFAAAKKVLTQLETQVKTVNDQSNIPVLEEEEIQRTLRQCHAARILLRRLKKLKHRLKGYHAKETHTVDDFQRVRIVEEV